MSTPAPPQAETLQITPGVCDLPATVNHGPPGQAASVASGTSRVPGASPGT